MDLDLSKEAASARLSEYDRFVRDLIRTWESRENTDRSVVWSVCVGANVWDVEEILRTLFARAQRRIQPR